MTMKYVKKSASFISIWESFLYLLNLSNHRHRTDVVLEVHDGPHLFDGKVNHFNSLFVVVTKE